MGVGVTHAVVQHSGSGKWWIARRTKVQTRRAGQLGGAGVATNHSGGGVGVCPVLTPPPTSCPAAACVPSATTLTVAVAAAGGRGAGTSVCVDNLSPTRLYPRHRGCRHPRYTRTHTLILVVPRSHPPILPPSQISTTTTTPGLRVRACKHVRPPCAPLRFQTQRRCCCRRRHTATAVALTLYLPLSLPLVVLVVLVLSSVAQTHTATRTPTHTQPHALPLRRVPVVLADTHTHHTAPASPHCTRPSRRDSRCTHRRLLLSAPPVLPAAASNGNHHDDGRAPPPSPYWYRVSAPCVPTTVVALPRR